MNGVRFIFRRKGYLLTALAAAVLLAASSGTAYAQADDVDAVTLDKVTITTSSERVAEGSTLTITVRGEARVPAKVDADGGPADGDDPTDANDTDVDRPTNATERTAVVNLMLNEVDGTPGVSTTGDLDDPGQVTDANIVTNEQVRLVFGENTGSSERDRTATATATVQINDDPDAENEALSVWLTKATGSETEAADDAIVLGGANVSVRPLEAASGGAIVVAAAEFTIMDTDDQTYVFDLDGLTHTRTNPPTENATISVKISAKPPHYQGGASLTLHLRQDGGRASGYTATGEALTGTNSGDSQRSKVAIGNGTDSDLTNTATTADNSRIITISQSHDRANDGENGDGNRVTDTITLSAFAGAAGSGSMAAEPLDIDVLDLHGLPASEAITAVAKDMDGMEVMEVVEGGDSVYLTVTVDRGTGASATTSEELTVNIRPADGQVADYDLSLDRVVLEERSSGKQSNDRDDMIKLSARPDEDVGAEKLTLNIEVSGEPKKGTETSSGMFEIDIVDGTMKRIEPKATEADYDAIKAVIKAAAGDDELNPGETFTLMTSDLFTVAPGYTGSYGVSVDGASVSVSASAETITINAVKAGDSVIVVTGTARMSSSSLEPSQTVSDVASLKFPVTVVDKDLVVTVAADPEAIDEGGTSMITATANRMVEAGDDGVQIDLEVVGDATVDANSITIAVGAMSGSAMLTAAEDDDDYEDGSVTVIASGDGINGNMQIVIAVTDNDVAPVDPAPSNTIVPKAEGDAYPVITGAIEGAAGADGLNPGESFSVPASDLFTVTDGYTAGYSASVDGDAATAAVSGDSVTVTAAVAGAAKVTITGTSKMASSSFAPEQVATNVAEITFEVMVVDTALVVTVAADPAEIMEGGTSTITATANRAVTAGDGAVEIGLEVVGDATVEPASITIAAGSMSGSVMLTATEDDDYADETVTVVATGSGIDAARQVTIAVTDNDAAPEPPAALVVTLGMPANVMNGNIVEGESYEIVVSADRMVTEDTEVTIMRDRAASDASEEDYSVSSATIMAGYDSAMATLMVTEDNDPDSGTNDNMGESLVLYGMAGDMATNSLTFTIWDQAVPSLPLIGQLLLALFLMLGGARLYRRRQG